MTAVVPIRFKYNTKTYWYKYGDADPKPGDWVVVARDGGKGFGWVEDEPFEISEEQEKELKSPLKTIIRVATDDDYKTLEQLNEKGAEAKKVFRELAEKRELGIKPIDVEYLMDCDRAIFHFSSEERVDFRELVRDLASTLHVHVDMRQIGVRDEARLVGGLGHCGEILCCVRMSNGFQPVSIRMAKDQDLPLNPSKVSGACGRLMCCLRYESEAYKDFKSRAPKVGTVVTTPAGDAKVTELNIPKEMVKVKMVEGDETFQVPLSGMEKDPEKDTPKPTVITEEAFVASAPASMLREKGIDTFKIPDSELLETDEKKGSGRRRRSRGGSKGSGQGGSQQGQKQRSQGQSGGNQSGQQQGQKSGSGSSRRRRRKRSGSGGQNAQQGGNQQKSGNSQQQGGGQQGQKQHPGQNSSGVQNPSGQSGQQGQKQGSSSGSSSSRRRRRSGQGSGSQNRQNRSGQNQGSQNSGGQRQQQGQGSKGSGSNRGGQSSGQQGNQNQGKGSGSQGGQRQQQGQGSGGQRSQSRSNQNQSSGGGSSQGSSSRKRTPRRTSGGKSSSQATGSGSGSGESGSSSSGSSGSQSQAGGSKQSDGGSGGE